MLGNYGTDSLCTSVQEANQVKKIVVIALFCFSMIGVFPASATPRRQSVGPQVSQTWSGGALRDAFVGATVNPSPNPWVISCNTYWASLPGPIGEVIGVFQGMPQACAPGGLVDTEIIFTWPENVQLEMVRIYTYGVIFNKSYNFNVTTDFSHYTIYGYSPTTDAVITTEFGNYGGSIEARRIHIRVSTMEVLTPGSATAISGIQMVWREILETPTPSNTPLPTGTRTPVPTGSRTPEPTLTAIPRSPTAPSFTKVAPPLTPYPTIDSCLANLAIPCASLAAFPTLVLPTVDLVSPTTRPLQPTRTPAIITATPTLTPTISPTPGDTPTPAIITATPNNGSIVEGARELGDQFDGYIPTIMPLSNVYISMYGTPSGAEVTAGRIGAGIASVVSVARSLELLEINKLGGIVTFPLVVLAFLIVTEGFFVFWPILNFIVTWSYKLIIFIVQIVQAVLKFIPKG
jgi:hypothetical protein